MCRLSQGQGRGVKKRRRMGDYYSEMAGKRRYREICLSRACVTSDYVRRGIGFGVRTTHIVQMNTGG